MAKKRGFGSVSGMSAVAAHNLRQRRLFDSSRAATATHTRQAISPAPVAEGSQRQRYHPYQLTDLTTLTEAWRQQFKRYAPSKGWTPVKHRFSHSGKFATVLYCKGLRAHGLKVPAPSPPAGMAEPSDSPEPEEPRGDNAEDAAATAATAAQPTAETAAQRSPQPVAATVTRLPPTQATNQQKAELAAIMRGSQGLELELDRLDLSNVDVTAVMKLYGKELRDYTQATLAAGKRSKRRRSPGSSQRNSSATSSSKSTPATSSSTTRSKSRSAASAPDSDAVAAQMQAQAYQAAAPEQRSELERLVTNFGAAAPPPVRPNATTSAAGPSAAGAPAPAITLADLTPELIQQLLQMLQQQLNPQSQQPT